MISKEDQELLDFYNSLSDEELFEIDDETIKELDSIKLAASDEDWGDPFNVMSEVEKDKAVELEIKRKGIEWDDMNISEKADALKSMNPKQTTTNTGMQRLIAASPNESKAIYVGKTGTGKILPALKDIGSLIGRGIGMAADTYASPIKSTDESVIESLSRTGSEVDPEDNERYILGKYFQDIVRDPMNIPAAGVGAGALNVARKTVPILSKTPLVGGAIEKYLTSPGLISKGIGSGIEGIGDEATRQAVNAADGGDIDLVNMAVAGGSSGLMGLGGQALGNMARNKFMDTMIPVSLDNNVKFDDNRANNLYDYLVDNQSGVMDYDVGAAKRNISKQIGEEGRNIETSLVDIADRERSNIDLELSNDAILDKYGIPRAEPTSKIATHKSNIESNLNDNLDAVKADYINEYNSGIITGKEYKDKIKELNRLKDTYIKRRKYLNETGEEMLSVDDIGFTEDYGLEDALSEGAELTDVQGDLPLSNYLTKMPDDPAKFNISRDQMYPGENIADTKSLFNARRGIDRDLTNFYKRQGKTVRDPIKDKVAADVRRKVIQPSITQDLTNNPSITQDLGVGVLQSNKDISRLYDVQGDLQKLKSGKSFSGGDINKLLDWVNPDSGIRQRQASQLLDNRGSAVLMRDMLRSIDEEYNK